MRTIHRLILAYMETRCNVSSQHKLPGKEELYDTAILGFLWKKSDIDEAIEELLEKKQLIQYGPYLSDHAIDVL